MKIINLILSSLLLISCSNMKGEYNKISTSFKNMIVFKKQIDSRETRTPIGNQKYIKDFPQKNNLDQKTSIVVAKTDTADKIQSKPKSYLKNIFKLNKPSSNNSNKYPNLDSVPTIVESDTTSLKKTEDDLNTMKTEIEQTRKEVAIIEENINELKDEKHLDGDFEKQKSNQQIIKEIDEEGFYNNKKYERKKSLMLPNSRYN